MNRSLRTVEIAATLVLAWAVVGPLLFVIRATLDGGGWSILFSPEGRTLREAVVTSLGLSLATAGLCTGLGAILAAWTVRRTFPLRRLAQAAPLVPLSLPPLVGVMTFLFLWGDVGLLAGVWRLWIDDQPPSQFAGFPAVLVVHVYSFLPLSVLLLRDGFVALDPDLDRAARILGAGRARRIQAVWWPRMRPAVFASAWITFMASMASFSAPYLLGGNGRYLSTEIVARRLGGELSLAYVETIVLAGISLVLLLLRPKVPPSSSARASQPVPVRGRRRLVHASAAVAVGLLLTLPHATLLLLSFVKDGTWTWQPLPPAYTLANHVGLFRDPSAWRPLAHSLAMALPATLLGAAWAVAVGRAEALGPRRWRAATSAVGALPWAVPATALAMAWLAAYNEPSVSGFGLVLASTPLLLPWAYTLRFVPLQIRAVSSALQMRGAELERAARTLGAGPWRAAWAVTFPAIRPALAGASALVFVLAVGEFVVSILLYVPENRPVSLEILSELRLFNLGRAAAFGTWLSVLLAAALVLIPHARISWNASSRSSR